MLFLLKKTIHIHAHVSHNRYHLQYYLTLNIIEFHTIQKRPEVAEVLSLAKTTFYWRQLVHILPNTTCRFDDKNITKRSERHTCADTMTILWQTPGQEQTMEICREWQTSGPQTICTSVNIGSFSSLKNNHDRLCTRCHKHGHQQKGLRGLIDPYNFYTGFFTPIKTIFHW